MLGSSLLYLNSECIRAVAIGQAHEILVPIVILYMCIHCRLSGTRCQKIGLDLDLHTFYVSVSSRGWGDKFQNLIGIAPIRQVTHVRNKNSNIQGRSLNVIKVIFHTISNCS